LSWFTLELVWTLYVGVIVLLLPCIVRLRVRGTLPDPPFILCAIHVGNLDPLFIVKGSGYYRLRAIYQVDGPYPFVRFLYKAFWRFRVTQCPERKKKLNQETMKEAASYLERGGILLICPEGYWNWERKFYPGFAVLAHRSGVPVVPVGIENGDVFRPELDKQSPLRALARVLRDYRRRKWIAVHFLDPLYPDRNMTETNDVERLGHLIAQQFGDFYRQFYHREGPVWIGSSREKN
jgi:1-acyl-sn-glycerol-3-phosphate acyltransferase